MEKDSQQGEEFPPKNNPGRRSNGQYLEIPKENPFEYF